MIVYGVLGVLHGIRGSEKGEVALIRRALHERWPIPQDVREKLAEQMRKLLSDGSAKLQVAASRVLIEADKLNLQDEQAETLRKIAADQEALNAAIAGKSNQGTGTAEAGGSSPAASSQSESAGPGDVLPDYTKGYVDPRPD